jgi:Smg protein
VSRANISDAALLAALAAEVGLDFANMDCMGLPAVPRDFYADSAAAGRPLAFMPEMGPTFPGLQWTTLTNGYWPAPGPVPDVDALKWLDGLAHTAEGGTAGPARLQPRAGSLRVYTAHEHEVLGEESIGFISFLESAGVMAPAMREMVIDRALAVGSGRIELDDLKIIVLMVFWSLGEEPDALVLDELFVDSEDRVIH